ncbi:MAG: substrate-binding domain-containing protein [Burkholderiales bacterium]
MTRLLLVLALVVGSAGPAASPLRVKASPAVAPCVAAAALAFERATGRAVAVETAAIGAHDSANGADVVVAADQELNRVIESGATSPDLDIDVAKIPWVLARSAESSAVDMAALAHTTAPVRMLGGTAGREALRVLEKQGSAPKQLARVREVRELRLAQGELAIVPLSLAGSLPVSSLAVPPLTARALGVRASSRQEAARTFLDFLAGEQGNAAFRACGRPAAR